MFKVGDRVECIDATNYDKRLTKGKIYTVLAIPYPQDRDPMVRVLLNDGNEGNTFTKRWRLAVQQPIAEGVVRLRVIEGMRPHLRVGDIVTVKKENPGSYLLEEHPGKLWAKRRFERIVEAPVAPKKEFKMGDNVIVVDGGVKLSQRWVGDMNHAICNGKTYEIVDVDDYGHFRLNTKPSRWFPKAALEHAAKPLRMVAEDYKPKVGEKFIVTRLDKNWAGGYYKNYYPVEKEVVGDIVVAGDSQNWGHDQGNYLYLTRENPEGYSGSGMRSACFPIKCLAHYEEGQAIMPKEAIKKPPVPPKKVLEPITKVAKEKLNSAYLNSWVYLEKGKDEYTICNDKPCYASLGSDYGDFPAVEQLAIGLKNRKSNCVRTVKEEELFRQWLEYVIEQSPFKSAFLTKTAEEALENECVEIDCSRSCAEIRSAATAIRNGWEWKNYTKVFDYFKEEGYSGHVGYIMAFCTNNEDGVWNLTSMNDGHNNMGGDMSLDDVVQFFREGYFNKEWQKEKPFNVTGKRTRGIASMIGERHTGRKQLRDFANSFGKETGKGWNKRTTINEEGITKMADALEQLITEKK